MIKNVLDRQTERIHKGKVRTDIALYVKMMGKSVEDLAKTVTLSQQAFEMKSRRKSGVQ